MAIVVEVLKVRFDPFPRAPRHPSISFMETNSDANGNDFSDWVKPIFSNGMYNNPWDTWEQKSFFQAFKAFGLRKHYTRLLMLII